jgi:hypothetical protein
VKKFFPGCGPDAHQEIKIDFSGFIGQEFQDQIDYPFLQGPNSQILRFLALVFLKLSFPGFGIFFRHVSSKADPMGGRNDYLDRNNTLVNPSVKKIYSGVSFYGIKKGPRAAENIFDNIFRSI